jgi:hypothetical protein
MGEKNWEVKRKCEGGVVTSGKKRCEELKCQNGK